MTGYFTNKQLIMPTAHVMALRRLLLLLLVLHVALAITFDTPALPSSLPQLLALASSGDAEGAAALLASGGASIEDVDGKSGGGALHWAAEAGHAAVIVALGTSFRRDGVADRRNRHGFAALHLAAMNGHAAACEALLDVAGAAAGATTNEAVTALHLAASNGNEALAALLMRRGGDPNARDAERWTPLHKAAYRGKGAVAARLIDGGSDAAALTGDGRNAAQLATATGHAELAATLGATMARLHAGL